MFNVFDDSTETNNLVEEAVGVAPEVFLRLIKRVATLMAKEQGRVGSMRVKGKLVHLPPSGEATIIGDLHGDLKSLAFILKDSGFLEKIRKGENVHLIFLGDYGDRGPASPEVYYIALRLKKKYPEKVILMRGNHEGPEDLLPTPHDLPTQLKQKYGEAAGTKIYAELRKLFNQLYNAVLIDKQYVLIHGGIPSSASSLGYLACAHKKHPKETHLEEMLWSDPEEELEGTRPSPRGAGKLFGPDITKKQLRFLNVKVLIRGHEACQEGFKTNHNGRVLTLFSTNQPPYTNRNAAYLQLELSKKIKNAEQLERYVKQF